MKSKVKRAELPRALPWGWSDGRYVPVGTNARGGAAARAMWWILKGIYRLFNLGVTGLETHSLHYAGEAFGGLRCNNGFIFRFGDHIRRFRRSCEALGEKCPFSDDEILAVIRELARRNNVREFYIRIFCYRGESALGVKTVAPMHYGILLLPWGPYYSDLPVRVAATSKIPWKCYIGGDGAQLKLGANYVFTGMALRRELRGEQDLVFLLDGNVTEMSGSNLFAFLEDGTVVTPPTSCVLDGITRRTAIGLLSEVGVKVEERPLPLEEFLGAATIVATGTAAGMVVISRIARANEESYIHIGDGKVVPIAAELLDRYRRVITGQSEDHWEWLTPL